LPSEHDRARRRRDRIVFWGLTIAALLIGVVALVVKVI
jgi:hypothetical protein